MQVQLLFSLSLQSESPFSFLVTVISSCKSKAVCVYSLILLRIQKHITPPQYSGHRMPPLSTTATGLLYHGTVGSLLLFQANHSVLFVTAAGFSGLLVADGALPAACSHFLPRLFEKKNLFHNLSVLFPGESCSAILRVLSSEMAVVCWVAWACSSLHC